MYNLYLGGESLQKLEHVACEFGRLLLWFSQIHIAFCILATPHKSTKEVPKIQQYFHTLCLIIWSVLEVYATELIDSHYLQKYTHQLRYTLKAKMDIGISTLRGS